MDFMKFQAFAIHYSDESKLPEHQLVTHIGIPIKVNDRSNFATQRTRNWRFSIH